MRKNIGKRIILFLLIGLIATKVCFMYDISYAKTYIKILSMILITQNFVIRMINEYCSTKP